MIDLYCKLIIARPQRKTFAEVPAKLQDAVEARLKELGFDTNGDPIV
jgi:hypothetical protein